MLSVATPLAACEARIKREPRPLPTVAIVGASYTAGTGPDNPEQSWAVGLAKVLHWNAVIYGVPGAGYVRASASGRGPMARMLGQEGLRGLGPALVIVQAGHDDVGVAAGLEGRRVSAAVNLIRAAAPGARIALLTTFAALLEGSPALRQTDHAIVTAGTAADPDVIVMDPLAVLFSGRSQGRATKACTPRRPGTRGSRARSRRPCCFGRRGVRPVALGYLNRAGHLRCSPSARECRWKRDRLGQR